MSDDQRFGLARKLAHSDKSVRDVGFSHVLNWLLKRESVDPMDYMKMWKALYYCMWMADKPLIQEELAENLAEIPLKLPLDRAVPYLQAFFQTMHRTWEGTDKLRLDKYYSLTRKTVRSLLTYIFCEKNRHNPAVANAMLGLLKSSALCFSNVSSRGVTFHVIDVFIDELIVVFDEVPQEEDHVLFAPLLSILQVFLSVMTTNIDREFLKRIRSKIFVRMIVDAGNVARADPTTEVVVTNLMTTMLLSAGAIAMACFNAASDPNATERSRSILYRLRAKFLAVEGQVTHAISSSDNEDQQHESTPFVQAHVPVIDQNPQAKIASNSVHKAANPAPMLTFDDELVFDSGLNLIKGPGADSPVEPLPSPTSEEVTVLESGEEVVPSAPDGDAPKKGKRRRRRASTPGSSGADVATPDNSDAFSPDTVALPVKRSRQSSSSGGSTAPVTPSSGDLPLTVSDLQKPNRAVHFSTTKSVRKFQSAIPMKVTTPARELVSKKSSGSVLKSVRQF